MDSDLQHSCHQGHFLADHHQQQASAFMTQSSAPSSFVSLVRERVLGEGLISSPSSPESERLFSRLFTNSGGGTNGAQSHNIPAIKQDSQKQVEDSEESFPSQHVTYYSHGFYQTHSRISPSFLDQNFRSSPDIRVATSLEMEREQQPKAATESGANGGSCNSSSNLVRHSSSPAGLLANISIGMENGYPVIRSMADYRAAYGDPTNFSATRLTPSSSRMSPITEIENSDMADNRSGNISEFGEPYKAIPSGSWDDLTKTISALNDTEIDGEESENPPRILAHHLSLQKTSVEMAALERILELQETVPCKIRAKRGCATHPRSIAERVRRTRISERMRKLQDLVPNMDKQTTTADMLDLAVEYIKDLQRQVKALSDNRGKCMCKTMQRA